MNRSSQHPDQSVVASRLLDRRRAPTVRPSVEGLESRVLLAGNVGASVVNGSLTIQGDGAANAIVLDQTGLAAHQVRVAGAAGTAVNHHAGSVVLSGVTRRVVIRMGDAADRVTLHNLNLPGGVSLSARGGANVVTVDNVRVAAGLDVANGSTRSTTAITDTAVGGDLTVVDGAGGQNVALRSVDVAGDTKFVSARRGATVTVDDSDFHGEVRVASGAGADVVQVDSHGTASGPATLFRGPVWASLNGGDDTLQLGLAGQAGNRSEFLARVHLRGGAGHDTPRNFDPSTHGTRSWVTGFESDVQSPDTTAPTVRSTDPGKT